MGSLPNMGWMSFLGESFAVFWLFALGVSFGSFLNVVAYRLPLSKTLLGSSHCPGCERPVPGKDNIPVLGWILLGGRCRQCNTQISARYPIVEFLVGAMFVAVGYLELANGCQNLPHLGEPRFRGFMLNLQPEFYMMFVVHITTLTVIFAAVLMEWDGTRAPLGFVLVSVLACVTLATFSPSILYPDSGGNLAEIATTRSTAEWQHRAVAGLISGLCGLWLAVSSSSGSHRSNRRAATFTATLFWALAGWIFGTQIALGFVIVTVAVMLVSALTPNRSQLWQRPLALLWVAALIQLLVAH